MTRADIEAATPKCPKCGLLLAYFIVSDTWHCACSAQPMWTGGALAARQNPADSSVL